ncbi:hypothetical protein ARMSODRAFT_966334 [Armillaria solidipes]|uniref:Uncharacterized protein n=1 Tax=Armillaria solidipes TaxID=1076256 RepID=A0A2H3AMU4_9AGAR|nr:hypothetical protein ARMSODRAFT_966334 [Armillaria solidipes]
MAQGGDDLSSIIPQTDDLCSRPRQPSAAELCPPGIVSGLDKTDAAFTALISKTWLDPSRRRLYSSLEFKYPNPLLAFTLCTSVVARAYIHTLRLKIIGYY